MCLWVSKSAHKSYPLLYTYINKVKTPLFLRFKLISFVEKLSGHPIGLYCYDLFPMNNFEFYQFVYICGANYFLIMSMF